MSHFGVKNIFQNKTAIFLNHPEIHKTDEIFSFPKEGFQEIVLQVVISKRKDRNTFFVSIMILKTYAYSTKNKE